MRFPLVRSHTAQFMIGSTLRLLKAVPREVISDDLAIQRVNIYDTDGKFVRQFRFPGTPVEARNHAYRLATHR